MTQSKKGTLLDKIYEEWSVLNNYEYLERILVPDGIDPLRIDKKALKKLCDKFRGGHEEIQAGSERIVFQVPNKFVLKIARTKQGKLTNLAECQLNSRYPLARAYEVEIPGIESAIVMEWVSDFSDKIRSAIPVEEQFECKCVSTVSSAAPKKIFLSDYSWVKEIDNFQVGFTNSNRLVVYDLGRTDAKYSSNQFRAFNARHARELCERICLEVKETEKFLVRNSDIFWN